MGGPRGSRGLQPPPKAPCTARGVPRPPPWRSQGFNGALLFPRGSKMGSAAPFWGCNGGPQAPQTDPNPFNGVHSPPRWGSRGFRGGAEAPRGSLNPPSVSDQLHPPPPIPGGSRGLPGAPAAPPRPMGLTGPPAWGGLTALTGVFTPQGGPPPPQPPFGGPRAFLGVPSPLLGVPWSVGGGSPQHSRDSQPPPRVGDPQERGKGGGPVSVSEPLRAESEWKNGGKRRNFRPGRRRRR